MIYNVRRFKQMMKKQQERQAFIASQEGGNSSRQKNISEVLQNIDLYDESLFQRPPPKTQQDEERMRSYIDNKKDYYKKFVPKKGEFKTDRLASMPTEQSRRGSDLEFTDSLKAMKVAPKSIKPNTFLNQKRKHEDILFEFSNAARNFVPLVEKHKDAYEKQQELAAKLAMEAAEDSKFEDEEYLTKYFDEMRD